MTRLALEHSPERNVILSPRIRLPFFSPAALYFPLLVLLASLAWTDHVLANDPAGSSPSHLTVFDSRLYFSATDGDHGTELWMYDGVAAPAMVADINPWGASNPADLTVLGSRLFFQADDGVNGVELWQYDGVNAPSMVADINYEGDSNPSRLTIFQSRLYFMADDGINGAELWVYDPTEPAAPSMVADINSSGSSYPFFLVVLPDPLKPKLYFRAGNGDHGSELWVYDGTANPPEMVADIATGPISSNPACLTVFDSKLYFNANDDIHGTELWEYDGGEPPTPVMVADINTTGNALPSYLTALNSTLYFRADNGEDGYELWRYEGGASSPTMVQGEIRPGPLGSSPQHLIAANFNSKLYFQANDGIHGEELWQYDEVNPPTMVADISDSGGSFPSNFTEFNAKLYFSANDGIHGYELWQYDGINPPARVANINGSFPWALYLPAITNMDR